MRRRDWSIDKEIDTARQCLRAEISFRKRLLENYLEDDPGPEDVAYVWRELSDHLSADTHLQPGGDSWAEIRLKDWLRDNDMWDEEENYYEL